MQKIIRTSTVASSLDILVKGQLRFLNQYFEVIAVSGADKHLESVRQREGVKVHSIPMKRPISPIQDLISLYRLYAFFRKEKPDIVHSMTPKAGLLSMIAARLAGVPIRVHTFTGLIFPSRKGFMQKILIALDRLLCLCATQIYPEGQGVKNDLMRYRITKKPLQIIANGNVNGIDSACFDPALFSEEYKKKLKSELKITPEDFTFVCIGRLVGDKGINELIAAFRKLSAEITHLKLLLVGPTEPELDPLLPQTIEEMAKNPSIISVGWQDDIRPYCAISNAMVFPSYREGFPNVVMQAGAMGLPSIVTDINGSNEIINQNTNGLIIPVKDETAIFNAMEMLLSDKKLYISLQKNARELIVPRFEQKVFWQAILAEYKKLQSHV